MTDRSYESYNSLFSLENPTHDVAGGYAAGRSATFHSITGAYKEYAGKVIQINPKHKYLGGKKIKLTKFKINFDKPIWENGETFEVGKVEDGRVITGKVGLEPSAVWLDCYCDVKKVNKFTKKEKVVRKEVFSYGQLEETNFCKVVG